MGAELDAHRSHVESVYIAGGSAVRDYKSASQWSTGVSARVRGESTWSLTSQTMSINDRASSPDRCPIASTSPRSEKMVSITETRSCMEGGQSSNRFQAGGPLHTKHSQDNEGVIASEELTGRELARLLRCLDASEVPGPSIVAITTTAYL